MEDADKLRRLRESLERGYIVLDLDRDVSSDLQVVLAATVAILDRLLLDAEHLADQRGKRCRRTAHLARENAGELVRLLFGGLVVDDQADAPVPVEHLPGCVGDDC